ncbi:MAG: glycine cleavage system protein GcvH [Deltaproteobacteria bacterium]|nr:glycine cleavage system protein GcvH [Deltaproteobacteria bacterium]
MKEINELILPEDVRYTEDHEWAKLEGEIVKIGLTDYAQDQLGDIVFVEFPEVGDSFSKGEEFGTIESVKAVSEIIMPVSGEVVAINEHLENVPELVNKEPYEGGWLIEVKPEDTLALEALMDKTAYMKAL